MSYSVVEALFDGRIIPWERRSAPNPERRARAEKIEREKGYFMEKMSLDDCKRFQELEAMYIDGTYEEEIQIYTHGFTLGAMLMLEVMGKKETIIDES